MRANFLDEKNSMVMADEDDHVNRIAMPPFTAGCVDSAGRGLREGIRFFGRMRIVSEDVGFTGWGMRRFGRIRKVGWRFLVWRSRQLDDAAFQDIISELGDVAEVFQDDGQRGLPDSQFATTEPLVGGVPTPQNQSEPVGFDAGFLDELVESGEERG